MDVSLSFIDRLSICRQVTSQSRYVRRVYHAWALRYLWCTRLDLQVAEVDFASDSDEYERRELPAV